MVVDKYGDRKVHKVVFVAEINQVSDLIVRVCCASGNVLNTGRCKNWNGKFNSNFSTADGWSSNVTTFPMIAKVPPNNFLWQRWSWETTFLRNIGVQDDVDGFSCKSLPAVQSINLLFTMGSLHNLKCSLWSWLMSVLNSLTLVSKIYCRWYLLFYGSA